MSEEYLDDRIEYVNQRVDELESRVSLLEFALAQSWQGRRARVPVHFPGMQTQQQRHCGDTGVIVHHERVGQDVWVQLDFGDGVYCSFLFNVLEFP